MLQLILTMIPVSDNGFRSAFICIISPPENIILPILYELPPVCCSHFTSSTVIPTPRAMGARLIGAMQTVIGSWNFKLAFYAAGFLVFIGALAGRFVCGWLCPFGLIQDLLHKIPFPQKA